MDEPLAVRLVQRRTDLALLPATRAVRHRSSGTEQVRSTAGGPVASEDDVEPEAGSDQGRSA